MRFSHLCCHDRLLLLQPYAVHGGALEAFFELVMEESVECETSEVQE